MKHTKTPWKIEGDARRDDRVMMVEDGGGYLFTISSECGHEAGIIDELLRCVNLHDDLVAACEAVGTRHRIMYRAHEQTGTDERGYWIDAETMKAVQAALAKAKEAKT